ncbi:discoidin domain-containing protein [Paenibacillus tuaregi]|uniref:discoidin domain-containing protein n=1 Tax=Paenibacillus tuaregi TaxID=1816681 RepID=UPI000837E4EE|nr:discoidin domain-containing protein [Paenibacillus tuaregi]
MDIIGSVLATPEVGWQRVEETNINMTYEGTWINYIDANYTSGGSSKRGSTNAKAKLTFIGTQFRVIGFGHTSLSNSIDVYVDGVKVGNFSEATANTNGKILMFEKTGMQNVRHDIELVNMGAALFDLDAIDIESTAKFINNKILLSSDIKLASIKDQRSINLIPTMTSNTLPVGKASASTEYDANYPAWRAFDKQITQTGAANSWLTSANVVTGWLQYEFLIPTAVNKYTLMHGFNLVNTAPKTWTFEGSNDGLAYTVLDRQSNITDWVLWTKKEFSFNNNSKYKMYRINITANNGSTAYVGIQEMEMFNNTFKLKYINGNQDENIFIDHGLDSFDTKTGYDGIVDISRISTSLSSGRTFEHSIDLSKRRVDKISFQ